VQLLLMTDTSPPATKRPRRVLVGGIGLPWLRDLDFGTQFIRRIEGETWPEGVTVEDLSYSAHRVLHRLQELRPHKVVLVGAMPRDVDPPGTIRRYTLDLTPPSDEDVTERLGEAIGGVIDLDHTLAIVRYWKGFPPDTVVIEVEPGDRAFGLGFSDEIEASVDKVLALIREEISEHTSGAEESSAMNVTLKSGEGTSR
ncbi:MAG: hydrogenase maturation protease, partial [Actinomycetota bacterium]|nr:hydrogenase maturation protease [Actinomycetota bacterium]